MVDRPSKQSVGAARGDYPGRADPSLDGQADHAARSTPQRPPEPSPSPRLEYWEQMSLLPSADPNPLYVVATHGRAVQYGKSPKRRRMAR